MLNERIRVTSSEIEYVISITSFVWCKSDACPMPSNYAKSKQAFSK